MAPVYIYLYANVIVCRSWDDDDIAGPPAK
jgi:hypothetical protein